MKNYSDASGMFFSGKRVSITIIVSALLSIVALIYIISNHSGSGCGCDNGWFDDGIFNGIILFILIAAIATLLLFLCFLILGFIIFSATYLVLLSLTKSKIFFSEEIIKYLWTERMNNEIKLVEKEITDKNKEKDSEIDGLKKKMEKLTDKLSGTSDTPDDSESSES